jgi:hypothetical protein
MTAFKVFPRISFVKTVRTSSIGFVMRKAGLAVTALGIALLAACGGGGSSGQSANTGTFVDAPVAGLTYACGGLSANTDVNGHFYYLPGFSCAFSIGNVTVGSVSAIPSDNIVTVQDAVGVARTVSTDQRVQFVAQFLQSLDDGSTPGKITIPASVTTNLSGASVGKGTTLSSANLATIIGIAAPGKPVVDATTAINALNSYLKTAGINTSKGAVTSPPIMSGNLILSRTVYAGTAATVTVGQTLPGGGLATNDGTFPNVFKNEVPDPSFGVTSPIYLDRLSSDGKTLLATFTLDPTQIVSSFASKSELALNVSTDHTAVTIMGYKALVNQLDVSNSNTAGFVDTTNPVTSTFPRAVAQISLVNAAATITPVNAYSGNNGRAAILVNGMYYMVGNAGNGNALGPGLASLSNLTGVQSISATNPGDGTTTVIGMVNGTSGSTTGYQRGFALQQLPNLASPLTNYAADKTGKDDNFRGMTIFNNTLYVSKGSGSNGVNTVYQVDVPGALANGGTLSPNAAITVLPGFNALSEKVAETAPTTPTPHPFGLFFADANTLYVADEGDGVRLGVTGKVTTFAGLAQYKLVNGVWKLAATFQAGLIDQAAYTPQNITWTVKADGLRNIAGVVNADGSVTIYATTSTVSEELTHDLGADPNQLVSITIGSTSTPANTSFTVLKTAATGERLGGVAVAP